MRTQYRLWSGVVVVLVVLALALSACGGADTEEVGEETSSSAHPELTASDDTDEPSAAAQPESTATAEPEPQGVVTGAEVLVAEDFQRLAGRRVGVIANQASRVADGRFLIDALFESPNVDLTAIFAPEHGVRGDIFAGEEVGDTVDPVTGTPIFSLYEQGSDFTPSPDELAMVDVLIYDLQDVGTRFYTFISTMGRAMQAAVRHDVTFMVLDRPNPQGGEVVEGFVRTPDQDSFVSEYPIPARYGLTAGELATMIQGEGWKDVAALDLQVVEMVGWERQMRWEDTGLPWVPPSFGLPTVETALVYPGTVLFETLVFSFGGGTVEPFTRIGAPWIDADAVAADLNGRGLAGVRFEPISYVPEPHPERPQYADRIRFLGEEINSVRAVVTNPSAFRSVAAGVHLVDAFRRHSLAADRGGVIEREAFFDLLAGTAQLREMLQDDRQATAIVAAMEEQSETFDTLRQPYLRY